MSQKCFDEGIIQAFFDGELKADMLEQVARHVSDCDPCAMLMSDIEAESESIAMAFEIENFELVPTERLRTRIFNEIATIEHKPGNSWLDKAAAFLGFANGFRLTGPSVAAFASLVLVAGVVGMLVTTKTEVANGPLVAKNTSRTQPVQAPAQNPDKAITPVQEPEAAIEDGKPDTVVRPVRTASYAETKPANFIKLGGLKASPVMEEVQPLEDETRYLQTISTLKKSVDERKDMALNPSDRVAYERDMAVVNNAINKMQKAARKNPNDDAAKQILLASYQNKIDLLNSVSDRSELSASLR